MQGADPFISAGLTVKQVISPSVQWGEEGLLKHLANVKVLRHQIVNSASFLLLNGRQCFPSPNSWSNRTSPRSAIPCAQSQGSTNPPRGRTLHNPDLSPSRDNKQFAPFPCHRAVNCMLSSVDMEWLFKNVQFSDENWTKAERFERKNRICNSSPLEKKVSYCQQLGRPSEISGWLIQVYRNQALHTPSPNLGGWLTYFLWVLVNSSQYPAPSVLPNK